MLWHGWLSAFLRLWLAWFYCGPAVPQTLLRTCNHTYYATAHTTCLHGSAAARLCHCLRSTTYYSALYLTYHTETITLHLPTIHHLPITTTVPSSVQLPTTTTLLWFLSLYYIYLLLQRAHHCVYVHAVHYYIYTTIYGTLLPSTFTTHIPYTHLSILTPPTFLLFLPHYLARALAAPIVRGASRCVCCAFGGTARAASCRMAFSRCFVGYAAARWRIFNRLVTRACMPLPPAALPPLWRIVPTPRWRWRARRACARRNAASRARAICAHSRPRAICRATILPLPQRVFATRFAAAFRRGSRAAFCRGSSPADLRCDNAT